MAVPSKEMQDLAYRQRLAAAVSELTMALVLCPVQDDARLRPLRDAAQELFVEVRERTDGVQM